LKHFVYSTLLIYFHISEPSKNQEYAIPSSTRFLLTKETFFRIK